MNIRNRLISALCILSCGLFAHADIWWVDAANYGKSGLDGTTQEKAFGTIQDAVNRAASGDTVKVKPGVYDQGDPAQDGFGKCRVVISGKQLLLESTGNRDDTIIVGQHSTSGKHDSTAVRCVYADTAGTELRGFTLRGGDTTGDNSSALGSGGGLWAGSEGVRLVDCGIIDCWGTRGCGMFSGTAIRCVFAGCKKYNTTGGTGAICRNSRLYCCIATGCDLDGLPGLDGCIAVNCTIFGNYNGSVNSGGCMINCISVNNGGANGRDGYDSDGNVEDLQHSVFGEKTSISNVKRSWGLDGVVLNASIRQFLAPALGDFRLISGSPAATNGYADVMFYHQDFAKWIPQSERYLDFNRKPIAQTGQIAAGAIQEVVPRPNCGAVTFDVSPQVLSAWGKIKVFGCPVLVSYYYAYPEKYPSQIHLPRSMFAGTSEHLYAYRLGSDSFANYRPPEMDDSFWAMPPANPEESLHISGVWASGAYYVDPESGDDEMNDGLTANTAFKTLKHAIEKVPEVSSGMRYVIYAAAGTYDAANEGDAIVAADHNNRVAVMSDKKWIRFKGAGRDLSTIRGAMHLGGQYGGCGPSAARCFYSNGYCVLQGFSLVDGFAGWDGTTANKLLSTGGSVFLMANESIVSDCLLSNCAAERGGGGRSGMYFRCKFENCSGNNGGLRNIVLVSSCSFVNCHGGPVAPFLYGDTTVLAVCQCSVDDEGGTGNADAGGKPTWNCALRGGNGFADHASLAGNVIGSYATIAATKGFVAADPEFVSSADLRSCAGSVLFADGARPDVPVLVQGKYNAYVTTDVDGRPLSFNADGAPVVGCYQTGVSVLRVASPSFGTIEPEGVQVFDGDTPITVTYASTGYENRPYFGIAVDGQTVTEGKSWTVVAPSPDVGPMSIRLEALASTNWYVNAAMNDDSGDGFTPQTAKKTLRAIMACALLPGDCVHAARGEYAEGESNFYKGTGASGLTLSRVEIPAGVTLLADEGPQVTVIRGKKGSGADAQYGYGGTGPVRCAVLNAGSVLKGFTLTDGHAASGAASSDTEGGGAYSFDSGRVVGCVVVNCSAGRCGGIAHGMAINCRIVGNASSGGSYGAAGGFADLVGCYIGPQQNDNSVFRAPTRVDFCTFDGASVAYGIQSGSTKCCAFKSLTMAISGSTQFQGCVFDEGSWTLEKGSADFKGSFDGTCKHVADLKLDADGVPSADSPVVNVGNNASIPVDLGNQDAMGKQRISNVTVDVGAFEHDWRAEFSSALGAGVQVTEASAAVTLEDGKVKLPDGASISGAWPAASTHGRTRYSVVAEAQGEGVLTGTLVSVTGSVNERFNLVQSSEMRSFRVAGVDLDFAFGFHAGGAGYLSGFVQTPPPGTAVIIR